MAGIGSLTRCKIDALSSTEYQVNGYFAISYTSAQAYVEGLDLWFCDKS